MEAKKAADADSEPADLVLQCTHLLSNMTDRELAYHASETYTNLPAEEQLLLFFRCASLLASFICISLLDK